MCVWYTNTIYLNFYAAYTAFYLLGLLMSMQVPFVGFQPLRTSEHMAAAGTQICVLSNYRHYIACFNCTLVEGRLTQSCMCQWIKAHKHIIPMYVLTYVCFDKLVYITVYVP